MKKSDQPVENLENFFKNLYTLALSLFLLIFLIFAVFQYRTQRNNLLNVISAKVDAGAGGLDKFFIDRSKDLFRMDHWAVDYLDNAYKIDRNSSLLDLLVQDSVSGAYTLDYSNQLGLTSNSIKLPYGDLRGYGYLDPGDKALLSEVNMALELFSFQHTFHYTEEEVVRSYYYSMRNFSTFYPYFDDKKVYKQNIDDFLGNSALHLAGSINYLDNKIPSSQIKNKCFWTEVYHDSLENKRLISQGVPVFQDGILRGVIAADLDLEVFNKHIFENSITPGWTLLINEFGQVITHTREGDEKNIQYVYTLLPESLRKMHFRLVNRKTDKFVSKDKYYVYNAKIETTGWSLIQVVTRWEMIRYLLPGFLVFYISLILTAALLIWLTIVVRMKIARPALNLARFIENDCAAEHTVLQTVPEKWYGVFSAVADAFRLKGVSGNLPGAIFQLVCDENGDYRFNFVSRGVKDLLGITPDEVEQRKNAVFELVRPKDRDSFSAALDESAKSRTPFMFEFRKTTRSGARKWVRMTSRTKVSDSGVVVWDGLMLDVSDRKDLEKKLKNLAFTDYLTGVYNRRHFNYLSNREISYARRMHCPLSVIMIDIDRFKAVNDNYGHLVGDVVIKKLADISLHTVRSIDSVGRIGGEEFAVTCLDCDIKETYRVAERLRENVEKASVATPKGNVKFTISAGVAQMYEGETLECLVHRADLALYQAKQNGRNRVELAETEALPAEADLVMGAGEYYA